MLKCLQAPNGVVNSITFATSGVKVPTAGGYISGLTPAEEAALAAPVSFSYRD